MTSPDTPVRQTGASFAYRPSATRRAVVVWDNRRILWILVVRDLKLRYSSSVLGYLWTLLDPLLLSVVYWLLFGFLFSRGAHNEQPYLLWILTGILPFQWTLHVLNDSGRLMGTDATLVTSSNLPREIWVVRTVLSRFIEFLFTLPITALFMIFYRVGPSKYLVLVPLAFVIQGIFNLGLGLFWSPLCMLYPDMQRVVRVGSQMYRYASPVLYGVVSLAAILKARPADQWPSWMLIGNETWPEWLLKLFVLNPLAGVLDVYHAVLFPHNSTGGKLLPIAAIGSIITFVIGWWVFRRLESQVLKEI